MMTMITKKQRNTMVGFAVLPTTKSVFKIKKGMFHEATEFSLPMTKNFTFIFLENPATARIENCIFDELFDGLYSQSNVFMFAFKKPLTQMNTKYLQMHNIKQICSGSQCVQCGQKSLVITRFDGDQELPGRTQITEHLPFCYKFGGSATWMGFTD